MVPGRKFVVAVAFASFTAPFAVSTANAAPPVITSTFPDRAINQMTINGTDLCCEEASVLLGEGSPLTVISQTSNKLVVSLPVILPPGNYALSVQIGPRARMSDETVVTIGAVGQTGAPGPSGGLAGYEVVTGETAQDVSAYKTLTVTCPPGKRIIGGGAGVFWTASPKPKLLSSFNFNGGWYGEAESSDGQVWWLQVQANCAIVAP